MRTRLVVIWLAASAAVLSCRKADPHDPHTPVEKLVSGCAAQDAGLVMSHVDIHYQDDLGGPGRLEEDLRQLFTVYGKLALRMEDLDFGRETVEGHARLEGRRLRFEGPLRLELSEQPSGRLLRSGVLTDLRSIIYALRERRVALERGKPERLELVVSPAYQGDVGGRRSLIARVRADLSQVDAQAIMVDEVDIQVQGDRARVVQSFLLITRVGERSLENRSRERLQLRKEGSLWRFIGGLG